MDGSATFTMDTSRKVMNPAMHKKASTRPGRVVSVRGGSTAPDLRFAASGTDIAHAPDGSSGRVTDRRVRHAGGDGVVCNAVGMDPAKLASSV
jgi:hypothetical protein